jgi:RNA polymerase sigma-70 factor (ECF subfamily)
VLLRGGADIAGAAALTTHPGVDPSSGGTGLADKGEPVSRDALATALMDMFRSTRSREAFDALVELTKDQLLARVHSRVRYLGQAIDPQELLQDAYINIYRYPDRFDASRPGAFRAWSTTIVDNSVRRHLRKARSGPDVHLKPFEILAQEPDQPDREPGRQAILSEQYREANQVFQLFLGLYLASYKTLSERERFVLQMVEVRGLRYAELAGIIGIRPEALKMVVFRARQRIVNRIQEFLAPVAA